MPKCRECNVKFEETSDLQGHLEKDHQLPRDFFKTEDGILKTEEATEELENVRVKQEFESRNQSFDIGVKKEDDEENVAVKEEKQGAEANEDNDDDVHSDSNSTYSIQDNDNSTTTHTKCSQCELSFPNAQPHLLKVHVNKVHQTTTVLKGGGKVFTVIQTHGSWPCPCCDVAAFANVKTLHHHFKTVHSDEAEPFNNHPFEIENDDLVKSVFRCPHCGDEFESESKRGRHYVLAHRDHCFVVTETGSKIPVLKEASVWKCPFDGCLSEYAFAQDLRSHYAGIHTSKTFQCIQCPLTFTTINERSLHVSVDHQTMVTLKGDHGEVCVERVDGQWPCPECKLVFDRTEKIQAHYKRHFRKRVGITFSVRGEDDTSRNTGVAAENAKSGADIHQERLDGDSKLVDKPYVPSKRPRVTKGTKNR